MDGNESFDPTHLGEAKEVFETRVSDDEMILIVLLQPQACTMLLRGCANDISWTKSIGSLHDALCVVKRCLESGSVVPRRSRRIRVICSSRTKIRLVGFARTTRRRRPAEALLCIPKTLAGQRQGFHRFSRKTTSLPLRLSIRQGRGQTLRRLRFRFYTKGELRDNLAAGVLEPTMSKCKSFKFAGRYYHFTLIDDMIKLEKEDGDGRDGF